jgi:hypothetical protein
MGAKTGRPPDYKPEHAEAATKLCALGATDYELADFFGVHTATIYRWKNTHAEFCEAVKVGKESADDRVERSLYNRAVGYSFETEKLWQFQGQVIRAQSVEHVPPDPGAAFNWLKNRRGAEWRDKQIVTGEDGPLIPEGSGDVRELAKAVMAVLSTAKTADDGETD